ncbi:hypothetical protein Tco_0374310 [Tanacetum coccineum]
MLVHGPIYQGEGSTVLVESHHTPTVAPSTSPPHISATPRSLIRQETEVPLLNRCEALETDLRQTKKVYGDAFTKLIKMVKKLEQTIKTSQARKKVKRVTLVTPTHSQADQPKDQLGVFNAAKESVGTASASRPVSNAGSGFKKGYKDKGKGIMKNHAGLEKPRTKMQQRQKRRWIARVHEEASSFNIEEWEDIQATIDADEELAQRIQTEEREKYSEAKKSKTACRNFSTRERDILPNKELKNGGKANTQDQHRKNLNV